MSEFDSSNEKHPNSNQEVDVNFDDPPGYPDEQLPPPSEYDPSHDQESVPDTAYTYKERNGRFYSITHEGGKEVISEFVFIMQNDEQQAAFDQALSTGQSDEFIMIEQFEYNREMTTVEVTQQFIIHDTPDGRYMVVKSNSRPLPEEEKEPEKDPDSNGDMLPSDPEQSGERNGTETSQDNEKNDNFREQSGVDASSELSASDTQSDVKEFFAKLTAEENARKAVADTLDQSASDPKSTIADAESAAGSDNGPIAEEPPEPARDLYAVGEPTGSEEPLTPASSEQAADLTHDQKPAAASQDEHVKPLVVLKEKPLSGSTDILDVKQQSPYSSESVEQSYDNISSADINQKANELVKQPNQIFNIETDGTLLTLSSVERTHDDVDEFAADAHFSLTANNDPQVAQEADRLSDLAAIKLEAELKPATTAKEQTPTVVELNEYTEVTKQNPEITTTDKITETIDQKVDTTAVEPLKKPPLAIQKAVEGDGEIIYSRQENKKTVPDVATEVVVAYEKPEIMTPKNIDALTSSPSKLMETTTDKRQPEVPAASIQQSKAVRTPEAAPNHAVEKAPELVQLKTIEPFTNELPRKKQAETQLTIDSPSDERSFIQSSKSNETITLAGLQQSLRSREKTTRNDNRPKLTIAPNSLEVLHNNESNPDPYSRSAIGDYDGDVMFHDDGGFTIFARPDNARRRQTAPYAFAAEVEPIGMVG